MDNDVHSTEFESKMDPVFRSDYETPERKRRVSKWNGRLLGRGMMPPIREKRDETLPTICMPPCPLPRALAFPPFGRPCPEECPRRRQ